LQEEAFWNHNNGLVRSHASHEFSKNIISDFPPDDDKGAFITPQDCRARTDHATEAFWRDISQFHIGSPSLSL
jgi:hypothetical protein